MKKNPERALNTNEAVAVFKNELKALNLNYTLSWTFCKNIRTVKCSLFDSSKVLLESGWGKGLGRQSMVSSMFESLEHFFVKEHSNKNISFFSITDALSQNLPIKLNSLPQKLVCPNYSNK